MPSGRRPLPRTDGVPDAVRTSDATSRTRPASSTRGLAWRSAGDPGFLTSEAVGPGLVRGSILASWKRSRDLGVAADQSRAALPHDPDVDTPLTRQRGRCCAACADQLDGQPMSVILTDPTGLVLSRMTADGELERHLDRVLLAPGFNYAEEFVGTNGIGTALEVGGPAHVFGHEHYAENLEDLACAGVPIRHPITGRTVGAVDLTCWARTPDPLLLTLAKTTAEPDPPGPAGRRGVHQLELLQEYLRTCRRMAGIVFAVSDDMVMLNDHARTVLDPGDQAATARPQATEALHGRTGTRRCVVGAARGLEARMHWRPAVRGTDLAGRASCTSSSLDSARALEPTWRSRADAAAGPGRLRADVAAGLRRGRAAPSVGRVARRGRRARRGQAGAAAGRAPAARIPVGRLTVLDAAAAVGTAAWADRAWPRARRGRGHRRHPARGPARRATVAGPVGRSPGRPGRARRAPAAGRGHARGHDQDGEEPRRAAPLPEHRRGASPAAAHRGPAAAGRRSSSAGSATAAS